MYDIIPLIKNRLKKKKKKDKKRMEKLIYLFHIDQFRNSRIIGHYNLYKTMSGTYLVYIRNKRYSTNVINEKFICLIIETYNLR